MQLQFYTLTGDLPPTQRGVADTTLANNRYARAFRDQLERVVPLPQVPEWEQIATKVFEYGEQAIRGRLTVDQHARGARPRRERHAREAPMDGGSCRGREDQRTMRRAA